MHTHMYVYNMHNIVQYAHVYKHAFTDLIIISEKNKKK